MTQGNKKFSSSMEDYLEAIYQISRERGEARISEISTLLGHKPPSVTEMLEKLGKIGMIQHKKYGSVLLTPEGKKLAKKVMHRHETLTSFLLLLGIDRKTAERDACRIEHVVHPKTVWRLRKLVEFIKKSPKRSKWLKQFKQG